MPAKRNIAAGGLEAKEELKAVLLADSFAHVSLKLAVDFQPLYRRHIAWDCMANIA